VIKSTHFYKAINVVSSTVTDENTWLCRVPGHCVKEPPRLFDSRHIQLMKHGHHLGTRDWHLRIS